ncbi:alpha/beta hydrolase family esterase [Corynebacterium bovis]|uniref:alpha/beta hydrolase family esterase n=1 Tax=Corynebacterium bovis TaxID=36808 RepID=UPI000F651DED|nr:PHB depolymerase family esterase [Corynebacterium bovis]RRO79957.1 hypothetical protein CXF38_08005 [Corynebacterium bovis]RRO80202.1 hypothetical protein CXF36_08905 [Corynebacterium bovis]RRO81852.1 hypothetical protein CXF37_07350 [Corynebacterium bovis]RRO89884.1 hypothetical protein CXF45_06670 [Corynebacterium bovis]RRO94556.1 hypothetical protein CXF29_07185 [Corynebacterium bovis]
MKNRTPVRRTRRRLLTTVAVVTVVAGVVPVATSEPSYVHKGVEYPAVSLVDRAMDAVATGVDFGAVGLPGVQDAVVGEANADLDLPGPGGVRNITMVSGGRVREFIVAVPASYRPGTPTPVVLGFHGLHGNGTAMTATALGEPSPGTAQDPTPWPGALAVYPQGVDGAWQGAPYARTNTDDASGGDDVTFVRDILDAVRRGYTVDENRIYAAGMSNGGGFAATLACRMPRTFAAVASVAGAYYPRTHTGCDDAGVSFLEIHGKRDALLRYDGGTRYGEPYLSPRQLVDTFVRRDRCAPVPAEERPGPTVTRLIWGDCADGREVAHVAVDDMGHEWATGRTPAGALRAGGSFAATREITAFFARHVRG